MTNDQLSTQNELSRGPDFPELTARPKEKELPAPDVEPLIAAGESRKAIQGAVERPLPTWGYVGEGGA